MNNGFIKLDRDIQQSEIWYDPILLRLWVWCLLKARYTKGSLFIDGRKIELDVGQFITGRRSIEEEFNLGLRGKQFLKGGTLMYNLKRLEKLNQIEIKSTNKYSLLTVYSVIRDVEFSNQTDIKLTSSSKQVYTKEESSKKEEESSKNNTLIVELVDYLNIKTGSKYRSNSKETIKIISKAFDDKYSLDDLKKIVDNMTSAWTGTDYEPYLRPSTLFKSSNLEKYLNWKVIKKDEVKKDENSKWFAEPI